MALGLFIAQLGPRLERGRDADNERLLEMMRATNTRAKGLVDGILEYARYGAAVKVEDVDMGALVSEVLDSLSAALREANASVDVGDLPTIDGDSAQLSRVLQNVIANSLKYRADQPPHLTIAAEPTDGFWLFEVHRQRGRDTARARRRRVRDVQTRPR